MPEREIVKVQLPLAQSRGGDGGALIYAEGRSRMTVGTPLPASVRNAVVQNGGKAFAYAEWSGRGWEIIEPAPFQDW